MEFGEPAFYRRRRDNRLKLARAKSLTRKNLPTLQDLCIQVIVKPEYLKLYSGAHSAFDVDFVAGTLKKRLLLAFGTKTRRPALSLEEFNDRTDFMVRLMDKQTTTFDSACLAFVNVSDVSTRMTTRNKIAVFRCFNEIFGTLAAKGATLKSLKLSTTLPTAGVKFLERLLPAPRANLLQHLQVLKIFGQPLQDKDFMWIGDHLPGLCSLHCKPKLVTERGVQHLAHLPRLTEMLTEFDEFSAMHQMPAVVKKMSIFLNFCLVYLPRVQIVGRRSDSPCIYDSSQVINYEVLDRNQPYSLEHLSLTGLSPRITDKQMKLFCNVKALRISEYLGADALFKSPPRLPKLEKLYVLRENDPHCLMRLLNVFGRQLRLLMLDEVYSVDFWEIARLCPNLRVLHIVGYTFVNLLPTPLASPFVDSLRSLHMCPSGRSAQLLMPPSFLPQILSAPNLEYVSFTNVLWRVDELSSLKQKVEAGLIFQNLRDFDLLLSQDSATSEMLDFCKSLCAFAPKIMYFSASCLANLHVNKPFQALNLAMSGSESESKDPLDESFLDEQM
ncbi:uncharacterized protein LOC132201896 [Neocloeon triangulifer]|uniref:uncharacterized protein LOC132201896 n=1 Tax=Neocloeon triangulifer TaxID=2078957 RepID=UPI00286ED361|nr:uncharacterized protein LOC132201896 [Neocloeon triangulifer]XP_059484423.1 uncharacterized protein LOC132201896 [Neocloeon triangulifer]XP_059484424.1 uncharacterized protein LOC132201896 [Neocloeon triangulifer]